MTTPAPTSGSDRPDPGRSGVTALLVSHEGARWLPAVLDGLVAQTRPPERVVAVDTGSTDDSVATINSVEHHLLVIAHQRHHLDSRVVGETLLQRHDLLW